MPRQKPFAPAFTKALGPEQNCELMLCCGLDNQYELGDIVRVHTERDALHAGTQKICGVRNNGVTVGQPFAHTSLPWIEQETYYFYKFTQVSPNVANREIIDPSDPNFGQVEEIREPLYQIEITGYGPNQHRGLSRRAALEAFIAQHGLEAVYEAKRLGPGQPMAIYELGTSNLAPGYDVLVLSDKNANVAQFFNNRLRHHAHRVCEDNLGRRTYFCGRKDHGPENIHRCWDAIEGATAHVRDDHRFMKHAAKLWQQYLILPVMNLHQIDAGPLAEPLLDDRDADPANWFNAKKRKHYINFQELTRDLPAAVRNDAVTPGKRVDLRQGGTRANKVHVWSTRQTKTLT